MTRIYLDHNATSMVRPEAVDAAARVMALGGNPSSVHAEGRAARAMLDDARRTIANACGAEPEALFFTSGGTEADNAVMKGAVAAGATRRFLVSAIEHEAVRETARAEATPYEVIPVTPGGVIDLDRLKERLSRWDEADGRPFAAIMFANNETGVIQPIAEASALLRDVNGLLMVDAAQALGKVPIDIAELGINYLTLSAHKVGAPAGTGAVVLGADAPFSRRLQGGGQERGHRAGTENLVGIAAFAAAVAAAEEQAGHVARLSEWRDGMERAIRAARPDVTVFGSDEPRLPNTSSFGLPGFRAETQVMALDLAGIAVSSGSACSSGKVKTSHVLDAMGVGPELAGSAIRVSLGWNSTAADADRLVEAWLAAAERAVPLGEAVA